MKEGNIREILKQAVWQTSVEKGFNKEHPCISFARTEELVSNPGLFTEDERKHITECYRALSRLVAFRRAVAKPDVDETPKNELS